MGHLPECKALDTMPEATRMFYSTSRQWFWEHGCICDRLRACEQRVEREWIEHCNRVEQRVRDESWDHGMEVGTHSALDAAREAVAAVGVRKDTSHDMRVQALAAIDALRTTNP